MNDFLTVNEVSEQLRCSRLTVTRWIKAKKLRAFKPGGGRVWRISRTDFEKFIKKGR
ncbi:MAG: helix-turn-helix domain-containing protein [Acidobacteria bacterium]|nr:helix-turn-helix domain-containing protein [Acidobacteriota bacterium]